MSRRAPSEKLAGTGPRPSRREFLHATATAGAVGLAAPHLVPAAVLGRGRRTAANERIQIGLIGAGSMGRANLRNCARHEDVVGMLDEIEGRGTVVDIVCNNAGIQVPYREDFWQTPVADFDLCFRVNFTAVATICYHFMPKMIERGFGRVINTTSGIMEQPQQAAYSASKAALDKYTTDLGTAVEGSDLLINLTDPGWLRTDMGGPNAPGAPEDSLPGVVVGAFVDDGKSGRWFSAAEFVGMSLEEAVKKAGTM